MPIIIISKQVTRDALFIPGLKTIEVDKWVGSRFQKNY